MSHHCTLEYDVSYSKVNVLGQQSLLDFMDHCCQWRHYSFDILKCGLPICKPPCLPKEVSNYTISPTQSSAIMDDHISLLAKCLVHRPQRKTDYLPRSRRRFTLKHVKNANLMLICEECSLWRLLYSCTKLSAEEQRKIQDKLADVFFYMQVTYWRSGWWLTSVYENLELLRTGWKLYYSAGCEAICVYCGSTDSWNVQEDSCHFPQCAHCSDKEKIKK